MSSNLRPMFSEMPWNVKQDIIDSTDFRTRCVLQKCSKTLRSQVNNSKYVLFRLSYIPSDNKVELTWTNDETDINVVYRSEANGCSVNGKFIRGEHYIDRSVADFAAVARHPKTFVDDLLVWNEHEETYQENERILGAFEKEFASCLLRIRDFQFFPRLSQHDHMRALALTRPGILKMIGLQAIDKDQDTSEIVASEHWKRAREVEMYLFRNVPAQSFMHFHKWYVDELRITEENAKAFVEKIFELGESFERGYCYSPRLTPETFDYFFSNFDRPTGRRRTLRTNEPLVFFKKMPGTMYHLSIKTEPFLNGFYIGFSRVLSSEVEV